MSHRPSASGSALTLFGVCGTPVVRDCFRHCYPGDVQPISAQVDLILIAPAIADTSRACRRVVPMTSLLRRSVRSGSGLVAPRGTPACGATPLPWRTSHAPGDVYQLIAPVKGVWPQKKKEANRGIVRLADPAAIAAEVLREIVPRAYLAGLRVVFTAGPRREDLDPFPRFLSTAPASTVVAIAERDAAWCPR